MTTIRISSGEDWRSKILAPDPAARLRNPGLRPVAPMHVLGLATGVEPSLLRIRNVAPLFPGSTMARVASDGPDRPRPDREARRRKIAENRKSRCKSLMTGRRERPKRRHFRTGRRPLAHDRRQEHPASTSAFPGWISGTVRKNTGITQRQAVRPGPLGRRSAVACADRPTLAPAPAVII